MILYSQQALDDFDEIFQGLLYWNKIELSERFIIDYVADLRIQCESICSKLIHINTTYPDHKRFGEKVLRYRRNQNTIWYIIYDIDNERNIYINKIISNYLTIKKQQ